MVAFPDALIKRHKDCVIIAGANTTGSGATMEYVGRNRLDAATLDRFVFLSWPLDKALEESLVANKVWLKVVDDARNNIKAKGIKNHMVTTRAALFGEALIAAGLSIDEVKEALIKKGLDDVTYAQVIG